jgi:hypothetical protein
MVAADLTFAFAPAAFGMFAGAALVGVHMALTHGESFSTFDFWSLSFSSFSGPLRAKGKKEKKKRNSPPPPTTKKLPKHSQASPSR